MNPTFIPKRRVCFLPLAAVVLLAACDTDPGKGSTQAKVEELAAPAVEAPPTAQPSAAEPNVATYAFSQADSKISFVGAKVTGKHDGGFETFSGTIEFVDADPTKSSVKVEIDNASITTDAPKLTAHLKTEDFFDVAQYPKTRFTSTAIKAGGEGGATHAVTGNLELHGITKAITFPATIRTAGDDKVEVDAEFAINRKDFGIVYPGMPDDLIKDNVLIKLALRAAQVPKA